jgi:hypothetical protein
VKIAQQELNSIAKAVNNIAPRDSSELHDSPMKIKVSCEKRSDDPNRWQNNVKQYLSMKAFSELATKNSSAVTQTGNSNSTSNEQKPSKMAWMNNG